METRSTPPVVVTSSMASVASLTTTGGRNGREQSPRSEVYPDLERERQNCPFSQEELTNLLDGGAVKTAERRALEEYFTSFLPEVFMRTFYYIFHKKNNFLNDRGKISN